MTRSAFRLGLTGGIGSGKSTVARMLVERHGAALVDADAISRATTASGGAAINAIQTQFGPAFINADGALDREQMRELVFTDPTAKKRLERIVHPLVTQAILAQAEAAVANGYRCVLLDIPLLVESGHWRARLDRVLVVDCLEETQVARVVARNAMPAETVRQIIASQASRAQRAASADMVLFNDGCTLDSLGNEVAQIAAHFGL
ncbi:dephospho-CoA kinase [Variovorax sp. HJSM1_2]|uniref:dephospho-CoA kinase n=1 Tax=Variovorax sp. HJSM1_2 TaxID=3366263 RepID=UPI003BE3DBE9